MWCIPFVLLRNHSSPPPRRFLISSVAFKLRYECETNMKITLNNLTIRINYYRTKIINWIGICCFLRFSFQIDRYYITQSVIYFVVNHSAMLTLLMACLIWNLALRLMKYKSIQININHFRMKWQCMQFSNFDTLIPQAHHIYFQNGFRNKHIRSTAVLSFPKLQHMHRSTICLYQLHSSNSIAKFMQLFVIWWIDRFFAKCISATSILSYSRQTPIKRSNMEMHFSQPFKIVFLSQLSNFL